MVKTYSQALHLFPFLNRKEIMLRWRPFSTSFLLPPLSLFSIAINMSELHSVFLKYNADGGAAVQEKEGRCGGDATSHRRKNPSLPALSLYATSQSRKSTAACPSAWSQRVDCVLCALCWTLAVRVYLRDKMKWIQFLSRSLISLHDSLVSIVDILGDLRLNDHGSTPGTGKVVSLLYSIQTGSGTHPVSCPIGTGDSFPW